MPSFMSGSKNVDDFNIQTYGYIRLTTIWNTINTNKFNRANSFLSYTKQRNCRYDLQSHISQFAEKPSYISGNKIVGELIVRRIVAYAWPQFGLSLTHQINLIIIMCFVLYNVTFSVTCNTITASRLRCRLICLSV